MNPNPTMGYSRDRRRLIGFNAPKNKRKIQPSEYIHLPDPLKQRMDYLQEKGCSKVPASLKRWTEEHQKWILHEHFYSHYDQQFYGDRPMETIFNAVSLSQPVNYSKFKSLQKVLPKPMRFTN